jgi:hypothetical protein
MNGLMACSCCPHGTASLRNKRTNPNLLCLSRLHVALPIPHATLEVLRTRPKSAVLLLSANCRYTHPLIRDADGYCLLPMSLPTFEPRKPYSAPCSPGRVSAVVTPSLLAGKSANKHRNAKAVVSDVAATSLASRPPTTVDSRARQMRRRRCLMEQA